MLTHCGDQDGVKDANDWATETIGDPRYPLSLLLRVITVSLETIRIVNALPALDILEEGEDRNEAAVLPFRRINPKPEERYDNCVPLIALDAAAGTWSAEQEGLPRLDEPNLEWVTWESSKRFTEGMFVAHVRGRSMEPDIPDGAYCLFRRVPLPSSPDRAVLVRHGGTTDSETGGQYTVKLYREERDVHGEKRVVLQPRNPEFAPLVFTPSALEEVRIVAEVVEILRG